jgi:PRTRC genetic system protein B
MQDDYNLTQSILVYKNNRGNYYLESHEVKENGTLGQGFPLLKETMAEIVSEVSLSVVDKLQFKGFIPKNFITVRNTPGNTIIAWTTKSQLVDLHFTDNTEMKDGSAYMPNILWVVRNKKLYTLAYKSARFHEKTKLFQLPLTNTYQDGSVCWGSGEWPSKSKYYEDFVDDLMRGFWSSKFSHTHKGVFKKLKLEEIDLYDFWTNMIETKEEFPNEVLLESNYTLKDLLRE